MSNKSSIGSFQQKEKGLVHTIHLEDPVKKDGQLDEYSLFEVKDKDNNHVQYYLDVASVYCYDSVCKVVPVRIFWDSFGNYVKFELDSKYRLEKDKGKPFSRKDYKKLHDILKDKNSPFQGYSISDMMKTSGGEGVDAITSATTIVLPDDVTIKGATLTCYTIWHWVYGGIVPIIQNITGDTRTIEEFVSFLQNENKDYKFFALQQIIRRKIYEEKIYNEVLQLVPKCKSEGQNLIVSYFEGFPANIYFSAMEQIIGSSESEMRIKCLNSFLKTKYSAPDRYFEKLSQLLPEFKSYQEIDIFLNLLDKTNSVTPTVIQQVMGLLNLENILISRRAYWFLDEKNLSATDRKKLEEFYEAKSTYF